MKPVSGKFLLVAIAALAVGLSACSSNPDKDRADRPKNPFKFGGADVAGKKQLSEKDLRLEAGALYAEARSSLESGGYSDASLRYDALVQRYPFTDYATQSELERVYAMHKEFKPDEALAAADRFLREHPRYVHADYAQYLKGVINSERDQGLLDQLPLIDTSKGDISNQRRAFDDFALLVQKYPNSPYNADARSRMAYMRNRMAEHDLHVVRYYMNRGAYLAAAKRAEQVIALYPGAPATLEALNTLRVSYQKLGLKQQEEDVNALFAVQSGRVSSAPAHSGGGMSTTLSTSSKPMAMTEAPAEKKGFGYFFSKVAGVFSAADRSDKAPLEFTLPSAESGSKTPDAKPAEEGTPKKNRLIVEIGDGGVDAEPQPPKP